MMNRESKLYNLGNGYSIECVTLTSSYDGSKKYMMNVLLTAVEWQDLVTSVGRITSPDEANRVFKGLVGKYSKIRL